MLSFLEALLNSDEVNTAANVGGFGLTAKITEIANETLQIAKQSLHITKENLSLTQENLNISQKNECAELLKELININRDILQELQRINKNN